MTPLAIINLVAQVGWPLAQQLITLYHAGNTPTTPDQWAQLQKLGAYTAEDSLSAQGFKIETGNLVPV